MKRVGNINSTSAEPVHANDVPIDHDRQVADLHAMVAAVRLRDAAADDARPRTVTTESADATPWNRAPFMWVFPT
jgi:hypothetical protein